MFLCLLGALPLVGEGGAKHSPPGQRRKNDEKSKLLKINHVKLGGVININAKLTILENRR